MPIAGYMIYQKTFGVVQYVYISKDSLGDCI